MTSLVPPSKHSDRDAAVQDTTKSGYLFELGVTSASVDNSLEVMTPVQNLHQVENA